MQHKYSNDNKGIKMHTLQGVIPAVRKLKGFEAALKSSYEWIIVLEIRLSQLR